MLRNKEQLLLGITDSKMKKKKKLNSLEKHVNPEFRKITVMSKNVMKILKYVKRKMCLPFQHKELSNDKTCMQLKVRKYGQKISSSFLFPACDVKPLLLLEVFFFLKQ